MIAGIGCVKAIRENRFGFIEDNKGGTVIFELRVARYSPVMVGDWIAFWTRTKERARSKYPEARKVQLIESAAGRVKLGGF
jgi:hypothetical protein